MFVFDETWIQILHIDRAKQPILLTAQVMNSNYSSAMKSLH